MYDEICRLLIDNGARLIYTANRTVGNTLDRLQGACPSFHHEVSINEKVAFELAFTGSIAAKRTACLFSTEGFYDALDPVMSSAYTGVIGGFVILCLQDTDEEIAPIGLFSKLPLIVVEDPAELAHSVEYAYYLSEKYEIPVLIQATPEGDEGRGSELKDNAKRKTLIPAQGKNAKPGLSHFVKNTGRWAATPKFRYELHKVLNEKIEKIRDEFEQYAGNTKTDRGSETGIITYKRSLVEFYQEDTSVLTISTVYPLPVKLVHAFAADKEEVFIIEGEYPTIELQIPDRTKIRPEHPGPGQSRIKPDETIHGFQVVRDKLGHASSINMAHGIKKLDPARKVLAITYENHFFHSGMAAFVNTLYNNSNYVLLIMVSEREAELKALLTGFGFRNYFNIGGIAEVERFRGTDALTVLFCKGII